MGVPKFFRYISERYPCLSEVIKEYQIPEFDNLYLDMNGIVHMCSHPDDGDPHFRITEEKIFKDIFHYIEVLFRMIRPQKLMFMAIDGVAPRAKMNQQRGRRFRTAKDSLKQEQDAKKRGEVLPSDTRFDSNCITPGTVFMARLHEQLKYFVVDKISNDASWQKCKVILSGHETPGEGEHKIMDYIRYMRAQPGYDPNTRHCLYGLDADLVMLGLCTHEPHFSLLREEVKFGKKSTKRMSVPEEITFYLLHLSLMREYLELEFYALKDKLKGFEYDLEKIIDDWVLMGFLVGNDFIPHLPNLHIANGALPVLYKAYMNVLPTLDGYINEAGTLNLSRFEKFMEQLSNIDVENFEEIREDLLYMEAKTGRKWNAHMKVSTKNLEEWVGDEDSKNDAYESLQPEKPQDSGLAALIKETDDMCLDSAEETEDQSDEDDAFENYKKDYYRNKLEYANVTPEVMRDQAEGYVRAIQWNLNYYYNGCCSWSWYYPHHYAPYISDIKGFANLNIEFDFGKPFLPFEQLLAVLPAASKDLLPSCYHRLMTSDESVIKQYYPEDFQTDLNGKKQEWEAVVLVPFIDENILLEAMMTCNEQLTPEEKKRNSHGPMLIYEYTLSDKGPYPAPEYFNTVPHNYTGLTTMNYDDVLLPKEKLIKGAYPGVLMNVHYPGFPTMKHLKYKSYLKHAKIMVFETPSRNENMIIQIIPNEKFTGEMIPVDLLGTSVFVGWPHLVEAKVVAISNSKRKYINMGGPNQYNVEERTGHMISQFTQEINGITEFYQRRWGIDVGETSVMVHVQVMIGRRYVFTSNGRLTLEKQFTENIANYPLQTVVYNIASYDKYNSVFRDVESVFPEGCSCFTLTNPYYGSQGIVQNSKESLKNGRIKVCISVLEEPDFSTIKEIHSRVIKSYKPVYHVARQLSMTNMLFSKITGSVYVTARNNEGGLKNVSIGLDLKFNKRNKETPGYTKRITNTWCYSDRTVELVRMYSERYPEVLEYLSQVDKPNDINVENIFGEEWEEKLKELLTWLRSLPTHSMEKQTCNSDLIENEVVEEMEKIIDKYQKMNNAKRVTMQIKPTFLYRPEIQTGTLMPDPKTQTKVLDRVVNVRSGFTVPLGLKGTVTAVHVPTSGVDRDILYDVLFDKPFQGGMKLNCSERRGYRLPNTAIINISYGQRLMVEKTGKPGELIASAEASQKGKYNYNNFNNHISNNFAQQYVQPQPIQQHHQQMQRWMPPPQKSQYGLQNQQPFQKESSAFAQFTGGASQKQPYTNPQYNSGQPQNLYNQPQGHQNNSSNDLTEHRTFTYQKSDNNFMPSFGGKQQEGSKSAQYSPDKRPSNGPKPNTNKKSDGSNQMMPSTVNTDILKTMLKIDKNPSSKQNDRTDNASLASTSWREESKQTQKQAVPFDTSARQEPIVTDRTVVGKTLPTEGLYRIMRPTVNTEFLKNMLKIGNATENNKKNEGVTSEALASQKNEAVQKDPSLDMFAQAAKAPASVRLLTYYQSNGLGLPRYQYFNSGNLIQSQITLPAGHAIIGKPAQTREEASEIVAENALEILSTKAKGGDDATNLAEGFPVPPKTWVQPDSNNQNNRNSKVDRQARATNKNKTGATVLNNSFVPLQAVKNHIGKVNNTSNKQSADDDALREPVQIEKREIISHSANKHTQKGQMSLQNDRRPRRERKTRIAAVFIKQSETKHK